MSKEKPIEIVWFEKVTIIILDFLEIKDIITYLNEKSVIFLFFFIIFLRCTNTFKKRVYFSYKE